MTNPISTVEPARLVAGRICRETFNMILADDLLDLFPDTAPFVINFGGDLPTEDSPRRDVGVAVQNEGQELQHGFVGYDD